MRATFDAYARPRRLKARAFSILAAIAATALTTTACETRPAPPTSRPREVSPPAPVAPTPRPQRPIETVTVEVPGDVPAFVLHGEEGATARMVFIHGRCNHGLGYVQAFQFAAAKRGSVVAPQGDQTCGATPFRRWSPDIDKLNARIEAALRASGYSDPASFRDMIAIGYSEGASRAEALAARFPERYSRVILIGAPVAPSAARLRGARGAVMMAGERDAKEQMKQGMRALIAAGVPATFMLLPGAAHGQMGPEGERVMGEAFDWLWANAKQP